MGARGGATAGPWKLLSAVLVKLQKQSLGRSILGMVGDNANDKTRSY